MTRAFRGFSQSLVRLVSILTHFSKRLWSKIKAKVMIDKKSFAGANQIVVSHWPVTGHKRVPGKNCDSFSPADPSCNLWVSLRAHLGRTRPRRPSLTTKYWTLLLFCSHVSLYAKKPIYVWFSSRNITDYVIVEPGNMKHFACS